MSKYIPGNHKHLTAANKLYSECLLNAGSPFKDIGLTNDDAVFTEHRSFKQMKAHGLYC